MKSLKKNYVDGLAYIATRLKCKIALQCSISRPENNPAFVVSAECPGSDVSLIFNYQLCSNDQRDLEVKILTYMFPRFLLHWSLSSARII